MTRVLVVDDDSDLREALTDLLDAEGFEVLSAENGLDALNALESTPVDVILLDFMMPVMNGGEFREAQLARAELAAIPVILASATYTQAEAERFAPAAVLPKPFTPEVLLHTLGEVVMASRLWGSRALMPPP